MFVFVMAIAMTGITAEAADSNKTLTQGKWMTGTYHEASGYHYYKITAPATGLVRIYVQSGLVKKDGTETSFTVLSSNKSTALCYLYASNKYQDGVCHYLKKGQTIWIKTNGRLGDKFRVAYKMQSANPVYNVGSTYSIKLTNATLKSGLYLGFRAPKTGVFQVSSVSSGVYYMGLFNNQRKQLTYYSDLGWYSDAYEACIDVIEYGVKKNQIYYMKLTGSSTSAGAKTIALKGTVAAAYDPCTTMGAARAVGYNKPATTALYTKCNSWYKFYLSSPSKVSVYINTVFHNNNKDKYYLSLYKQGSSKPLYSDTKYGDSGYAYTDLNAAETQVYIKSRTTELAPNYTLSKGMYYLRVATTAYSANGYTNVWYGPCSD